MYISLVDIYSHFKGKDKKDFILYCRKGEKLTLISDNGEVKLLQTKAGEKFPAHYSKVKEI